MTTTPIREISGDSEPAAKNAARKDNGENSFGFFLLAASPAPKAEAGGRQSPAARTSPCSSDSPASGIAETAETGISADPESAASEKIAAEATRSLGNAQGNQQAAGESGSSRLLPAGNIEEMVKQAAEAAADGKKIPAPPEQPSPDPEKAATSSPEGASRGGSIEKTGPLPFEAGAAAEKSWDGIVKAIEAGENSEKAGNTDAANPKAVDAEAGGETKAADNNGSAGSKAAETGNPTGKRMNPETETASRTATPDSENPSTAENGDEAEASTRTVDSKAGEKNFTGSGDDTGKAGRESVEPQPANTRETVTQPAGSTPGGGKFQAAVPETPPAEEMIPFRNTDLEEMFRAGRLAVLRNGREARMVLHPPELGRLRIRLYAGPNRSAARFIVETPEAREALLAGEHLLREAFEKHGLEIDEFEVEIVDSGSDGRNGRYEDENSQKSDGFLNRKQSKTENNASFTSSNHPSGLINIYA